MKILANYINVEYCLALFSVLIFGCGHYCEDIRYDLQPLIIAIEKYTEVNERYPEDLHQLVPIFITELPKVSAEYEYQIHGKYYLLSFKHGGTLWDVYWSKDKTWYKSDFTEWPEK